MTKLELTKAVAFENDYNVATVAPIVDSIINHIKEAVAHDDEVTIRGFGTFCVKDRKQKVARIIARNEPIIIPAHKAPCFIPCKEFKEVVK